MACKDGNGFAEICQCSVCLEHYSDPRMLPCSHCFCIECLENLLNVRPEGGKISFKHCDVQIVCPNCRDTCKFGNEKLISSLPRNLHLSQLIELLDKRPSGEDKRISCKNILECSICKVKPDGTWCCSSETGFVKCTICCNSYCTTCFKQEHATMIEEVSNKHKTMVWKFNKDRKLCLGCKDHKLALKYYCNECDKVTCIDCCLAYHSWHELRT